METSFKERLFNHFSEKYGDSIVLDHGMMILRKYIESFKDDFEDVIYVSDEIDVSTSDDYIKINNVQLSFQTQKNSILVIRKYLQSGHVDVLDTLVPSNGNLISDSLIEGTVLSVELFDKYLEISFRSQMA